MDCEKLHAFADGELRADEVPPFEKHLARCTDCQSELRDVMLLEALCAAAAPARSSLPRSTARDSEAGPSQRWRTRFGSKLRGRSRMRLLGILAMFVLSVCAITEGAFLFRLSGRMRELSREVALSHDSPVSQAQPLSPPPAPRRLPAAAPRPLDVPRPITAPPAFAPAPAATVATATLRDALGTAEGREHLRKAMDIIAEQRRQERLVQSVERREERDQGWKESIVKAVPLSGDEPVKLTALFATLQTGRRQLLEDMRAGARSADDTDSAVDELQQSTQKGIRALLGEDRWKKMREGDGRGSAGGRQGGRRGPPGQAQGAQAQGSAAQAQGSAARAAAGADPSAR
jgi:hypothetical protein